MNRLLAILMLALASANAWAVETVRTPHAEVRLVAERATYAAGEPLWVGLHFDLVPQWHVYWRNPGDSGEAPRIDWQLPAGWQAGDIHWPVPERIPVGPLVNYGYEDRVTLLVPVTAPAGADGPATLTANATWLVCKVECIPEQGTLSLQLDPAGAGTSGPAPDPFASVRSRWPRELPAAASYRAVDGADALQLELPVPGWDAARVAEVWFAGNEWGPVASSGEQTWSIDDDRLRVTMPVGDAPLAAGAALNGLLVVTEDTGDGAVTQGFEIGAIAAPAAAETGTAAPVTLLVALGLAFAGGLLLNLMPCVLPVLSIKVLGLVGHAESQGRRHAAAFLAGVIATFGALALVLIALRASGEALGWGFQLQEPIVIVVLMYLMLALGLNLSGAFSMGARLMGVGQGAAAQQGAGGAFATGVLAVVVASPCTAPFMGTALGFALTRPPLESLAVFMALGIGFALPVVLLSLFPAWLRFVPPPGAWMERLRNALAFPMYGAAAWLLWVLSQQVDAATLASALGGALLLAFALWWYGQPLRNRGRQVLTASVLGLAALGLAATATVAPPAADTGADAQAWSAERVREHRSAGRPVLVNFTAAWCITCKVNEQVALSTDGVREALRQHDVAYLKGDWTRRDAAITAELQRHGRSGVPLYLLYPAGGGDPEILPQVLTEGLVVQAIQNI